MSVAYGGRRRGQPLVVLALLVGGWIALRCAMWLVPLESPGRRASSPRRAASSAPPVARPAVRPAPRAQASDSGTAMRLPVPPVPFVQPPPLAPSSAPPQAIPAPGLVPAPWTGRAAGPPSPSDPRVVAGHELLLMAGLGYLTLPESVRPALAARPAAAVPRAAGPAVRPANAFLPRWSADGWLLLRRGEGAAALAAGTPSYGASQAGAVLRYRLSPSSPHRPTAYVRLSGALDVPGGEREAAAGLALRPFASLPLSLLGEARVTRSAGTTRVRPAALLVTELPPQRLPLGAEAEVYGQAGYVGGPGASAFFDLQAVADRTVGKPARGLDVRLGAGAWAGGQRGAARLDLGPRASARLRLAGGASRLAFDWRFRVAGRAEPGSGPALTLTAGF